MLNFYKKNFILLILISFFSTDAFSNSPSRQDPLNTFGIETLEISLVYGIDRSLSSGGALGITSLFKFSEEKTKEWSRWVSPGEWARWAGSFIFREGSLTLSAIKKVTDLMAARIIARFILTLSGLKDNSLIEAFQGRFILGFIFRTSLLYGYKQTLATGGKEGILSLATLPPQWDKPLSYLSFTPYFTYLLGDQGWVRTVARIAELGVSSFLEKKTSQGVTGSLNFIGEGIEGSD